MKPTTTLIMDEEKHPCPFEGCTSSYKKKKGVKDHLIQIIGTDGYDRFHQREDPMWHALRDEGFFKVLFSQSILLTYGLGESQRESHGARKGGATTGNTTQALFVS
jgi:hypothetical protein